jgi:L-fuconolactonase
VSLELGSYRASLDQVCDAFGPDRVIYGSNWPVSDRVAPYEKVFAVVRDYFSTRGSDASDRYFNRNSRAAYLWERARQVSRPQAAEA